MEFTDDDLGRLKVELEATGHKVGWRLINRLECAERIICSYSEHDYKEDRHLLVKKWLQSKGVKGA